MRFGFVVSRKLIDRTSSDPYEHVYSINSPALIQVHSDEATARGLIREAGKYRSRNEGREVLPPTRIVCCGPAIAQVRCTPMRSVWNAQLPVVANCCSVVVVS